MSKDANNMALYDKWAEGIYRAMGSEAARQSCPKCGSVDLNKIYRAKGVRWRKEDRDQESEYVEFNGYCWLMAKKEFLQINCRTCQYSWCEDCLDKK